MNIFVERATIPLGGELLRVVASAIHPTLKGIDTNSVKVKRFGVKMKEATKRKREAEKLWDNFEELSAPELVKLLEYEMDRYNFEDSSTIISKLTEVNEQDYRGLIRIYWELRSASQHFWEDLQCYKED